MSRLSTFLGSEGTEHVGSVILTPARLDLVDARYKELDGSILSRATYPDLYSAIGPAFLPASATVTGTGYTTTNTQPGADQFPSVVLQPNYQRTAGGNVGYYMAAIFGSNGGSTYDAQVAWAPATPGANWTSGYLEGSSYTQFSQAGRLAMTDNNRIWMIGYSDNALRYNAYGVVNGTAATNVGTVTGANNLTTIAAGGNNATKDYVMATTQTAGQKYYLYNGTSLVGPTNITGSAGSATSCVHDGTYWRLYTSSYECWKSSVAAPGAGDWTKETNNVTLDGVNWTGYSYAGGMFYLGGISKFIARPTSSDLVYSDDGVAWYTLTDNALSMRTHHPIWTGSVANGGLGYIIQTTFPGANPTPAGYFIGNIECWDAALGRFSVPCRFPVPSLSNYQFYSPVFNYLLQSGLAMANYPSSSSQPYKACLDLQHDPTTHFALPPISPQIKIAGADAVGLDTFGGGSNANKGLRAYIKVVK